MIEETTISELDPRQIKQLLAADKALNSNPPTTIYHVKEILGFLKLRAMQKLLNIRYAQIISASIFHI